ncbi:hypothetical protein A2533_00285 [Candidatus Falkowbacteria bacterium RIFOXYD2_FULL_35_9]|uniref:DUF4134 domain-containing protein n=1 Tax=Candidatus Falkowbacteria bacterium RIFOXYC2_FULL_36_12 TaxID=1798002 RepID=A0A1F5T3H3_9BACT|nr:MAG: hypothetical protein A2300_03010 [Candidatus Falkowbacteria bacterium RIFOXYB2_FULL_35_7]OGF33459.1 MAG: hypothetical protein A2478_02080 [Candidatus Falkowbacteria bacterium RIFOXYC2_FULL_36_12]OGF34107.1 MAG: hypothetical protein A2223_01590 [Candidatus Falkowbacteria bacterium RIFOXYA2_FULL_35_8]OGF46017.1 MAG: hypothetical protein A2533_00285 [Candidatus Falkowbacteria bacterium RIFOXYD2_FULL_35_9]
MLKKIIAITMVLTLAIAVATPVLAASDPFGVETVGTELNLGNKDIRQTIGEIINVGLGFLGVVAIIIVLIGGFKYMTAGGAEEKTKEARKWIISGVIGLAIILSAYAITTFVVNQLVTATGSGV